MSRLTFYRVLALCMSLLLASCGTEKSSSTTLATTTPSSWSPPPVAASCTVGDADQDGACDDVDPDTTNPDSDNDGEVDGMDPAPKGKGSDKDGKHLSPLFWALGGVAALAAGSVVYNAFTSNDCQTVGLGGINCLEPDWNKATVEFTHAPGTVGSVDTDGQLIIIVPVTVHREHWLTYGFDLGADYTGNIEYHYRYRLVASLATNITPALPDAKVLGGYLTQYFFQPTTAGGSTADLQKPLATGMRTFMDKDGCDGKNFYDANSTGALLKFNGAKTGGDYCLSNNFIQGFPTLFTDDGDEVIAAFTDGTKWDKDSLRLNSVDATKPLTLPPNKIFKRNASPSGGAYEPENPIKALWK